MALSQSHFGLLPSCLSSNRIPLALRVVSHGEPSIAPSKRREERAALRCCANGRGLSRVVDSWRRWCRAIVREPSWNFRLQDEAQREIAAVDS